MFLRMLLFSLVIASASPVRAQYEKKKDRFPSYFGLNIAPVFPNNFIGSRTAEFRDSSNTMTTTFDQQTGLSFGASVRIGLTRTISLETGIYQIRRNFNTKVSVPDSNVNVSGKLSFVSYDIPLNALFYVQLSEKWYMNAALGISISHYPSDVRNFIYTGGPIYLQMEGRRVERTHFSTNAGVGFEFRTKKSGTFYLGGSGKIPFRPIMLGVGFLKRTGTSNQLLSFGRVNGSFFSVDLRYYIPTTGKKGKQFENGPIEQ